MEMGLFRWKHMDYVNTIPIRRHMVQIEAILKTGMVELLIRYFIVWR